VQKLYSDSQSVNFISPFDQNYYTGTNKPYQASWAIKRTKEKKTASSFARPTRIHKQWEKRSKKLVFTSL